MARSLPEESPSRFTPPTVYAAETDEGYKPPVRFYSTRHDLINDLETIELHDQLIPDQDPQGLGQIKPARHTATRVF